ncbi:MAG: DoxX family membrane protein [Mycobacterium sp.]|nr:DoxX family membrane protein [Mycobacterium sp.]
MTTRAGEVPETSVQRVGRVVLGAAMIFAGVGHLSFARQEFQAQVPSWLPLPADITVLASGVVEIALGVAMIFMTHRRAVVGVLLAVFFVAIFPGNVAQWLQHRDAFGLSSDRARFLRLFFQPVLIAWALWATSGWRLLRPGRAGTRLRH